jgi:hypothetical protein
MSPLAATGIPPAGTSSPKTAIGRTPIVIDLIWIDWKKEGDESEYEKLQALQEKS